MLIMSQEAIVAMDTLLTTSKGSTEFIFGLALLRALCHTPTPWAAHESSFRFCLAKNENAQLATLIEKREKNSNEHDGMNAQLLLKGCRSDRISRDLSEILLSDLHLVGILCFGGNHFSSH